MESGVAVVVGEVEAGHDCGGSRYLLTVKPVRQLARTFFQEWELLSLDYQYPLQALWR